jgi:hypothetical protein
MKMYFQLPASCVRTRCHPKEGVGPAVIILYAVCPTPLYAFDTNVLDWDLVQYEGGTRLPVQVQYVGLTIALRDINTIEEAI